MGPDKGKKVGRGSLREWALPGEAKAHTEAGPAVGGQVVQEPLMAGANPS